MAEFAAETLPRSKQVLLLGRNVFDTLFYIFIFTIVTWYIQYHWKRRRLYESAFKRNGPITLPFIGNALCFAGSNKDILRNIMRIADTYESPVRIWLGQRLFFFTYEPQQVEILLNSPHSLKKEELYKYAEVLVGTGLFTAPVPKWKINRRIITPTFNQKILDGFVEVFSKKTNVLIQQLEKVAGKGSFDIFNYISRCTLETICETAMGSTVDVQTTDSEFAKCCNKAMEIIFTRMFAIWQHYDFIFNWTSKSKELADASNKIHDFTGAVVKEKRLAYQNEIKENREGIKACTEEGKYIPPTVFHSALETLRSRNSFLHHLIDLSEKEGANLTNEAIREEVDTFMIAGSDTTAVTDSFLCMMLGMFPDVQEKVYQEALEILGPDRAPEPKDLAKFVYLERVVKETLRLFPIGPIIVREVTEDIKLDNDTTIPAGSSVVIVIMKTHMHLKIWKNPTKFDPDRFLPEESSKRHPYCWLPFSAGPRNCVGLKFAMMAIKTLIPMVIRKYRISTEYKTPQDIKCKADLMLKPVDGFKVSIELRD